MTLTLSVQPGSSISIYRQIVDQICAAVASGRVREDEPLPSVRALAEQLLINPNTVARAYSELARDGVIEGRAGRGMFIAERRQIYTAAERGRRIDQAVTSLVSEAFVLGFTVDDIVKRVVQKGAALDPNAETATAGHSPKRGSR